MKILYVTDQAYLYGGAEKILIQKLNYWADVFGYDTMVVTTQQAGRPFSYPLSSKVKHLDINVGYDQRYLSASGIRRFPKHYRKLKEAINAFQPDAIFLISLSWIRLALPFIAKGYPIYNEYHTSYHGFAMGYRQSGLLSKLKIRLNRTLTKWAESRYTAIVFLSRQEADLFKRRNAVVIPNFFDPAFAPVDLPKKNQVIALGRLTYQKGYDLLLEAWAKVVAQAPGWSLVIYGTGELADALRAQVRKLGLQDSAHLPGATAKVNEKLSESQLYVLSSRIDNFPMVLLESLFNHVPVVAFDCPNGPAAILTHGEDALIVPREDVAALATGILHLIENPKLREQMGRNGARNVQRFSPNIVMAQWDQLVHANAKQPRD